MTGRAKYFQFFILVLPLFSLAACKGTGEKSIAVNSNQPMNIKEENITYTTGNVTMNGFVAYNDSSNAKRPVVLIVHEW